MTGAELKAQVRDCLRWRTSTKAQRDALDRCVLLTAEEAEKVRRVVGVANSPGRYEALALLGGEKP